MTVQATCTDCHDVHPLGDRPKRLGTTACPACGSPRYDTLSTERIVKSEADRIRDAVSDVQGVGGQNLDAIVTRYSTLAELEAASASDLRSVQGVGRVTAERIVDEFHPTIDGFVFGETRTGGEC